MSGLSDGQQLTQSASVAARDRIRQAILQGQLEPGQRLKEEELARDFGISRTPIREALLMLQMEGLVVAERNRTAVVRKHDRNALEGRYQLRALLEGHAAKWAATNATAE